MGQREAAQGCRVHIRATLPSLGGGEMWSLLPAVDCDPDSVPRAEESLQVSVSLTPLSPGSSSASASASGLTSARGP